jgi:tetratricopeptide (TPR) repeat protein
MKPNLIFLALMLALSTSCSNNRYKEDQEISKANNTLIGKWIRMGHNGPTVFDFKENGMVEGAFGNDQTIDILSKYELRGDTLIFTDKEGEMCQGIGKYKVFQTKYYVSFELIDDDCGGRIKTSMGFWTKPSYMDIIESLDQKISLSPTPELYLNRARVFLAIGRVQKAREDFDSYISKDTLNPRAYVNRAGTKFPMDLKGVVFDCNKAISLQADNKNAYFLRGLARYELGEKELGCQDFSKAIELGFSILRIAEQEKCIDYWD